MKTDYSDLIGKELETPYGKAYVQGCDYHIGITISRQPTGTSHLICLWNSKIHKSVYKKEIGVLEGRTYRKIFQFFVKRIQSGKLTKADIEILKSMYTTEKRKTGHIRSDSCPFSQ